MKKFREPIFDVNELELRFEDNCICIYGTKNGLKKLSDLCNELINTPAQGHIHLEDRNILTKESEKGAIAIF